MLDRVATESLDSLQTKDRDIVKNFGSKLACAVLVLLTPFTQVQAQQSSSSSRRVSHEGVRHVESGKSGPSDSIIFADQFHNPVQTAHLWSETMNGGSVSFTGSSVCLKSGGKGFPVLQSVPIHFSATSDWTISFGYHFTSIGNYGTGIHCERDKGNGLCSINQDVNGQFLLLNGTKVWQVQANTDWHVVSVIKMGLKAVAFVDGKMVGEDNLGDTPNHFTIGGSLQTNPWDWNDLELRFVRVEARKHILDLAYLELAGPTNHPSSPVKLSTVNNKLLGDDAPFQDQNTASLPDTLDWLARTINHYAGHQETSLIDGAVHEENYSGAYSSGKDIIFTWENIDPNLPERDINNVTIALDGLDASKTILEEERGLWDGQIHYVVLLEAKAGQQPVKRQVLAGYDGFGGIRDRCAIAFSKRETAMRFVKALTHAIELSSSTKDIF